MTARARLLLAAAAVCAAFTGFWLARQLDREAPQLASGTWLPRPNAVADFRLLDTTGQPFTRQDLIGGHKARSLLIADSERMAHYGPSLIAPIEYAPCD